MQFGVRLLLFHPDFSRSCDDCERYLYDDSGPGMGDVVRLHAPGKPPKPRPPGAGTPCDKCPKIPAGDKPERASAVEMSEQSERVYRHYLECRAVRSFPDDDTVRRNARLIRAVHDAWERQPLKDIATILGMKK